MSSQESLSGYEHIVFISHRGSQKAEVAFPMTCMFAVLADRGSHFCWFDQIHIQHGAERDYVSTNDIQLEPGTNQGEISR